MCWEDQLGKIQNSGQNLFYDPGFLNTGKPLVKALITEGEFLVVNAKLIEDGGVQVTNMDWIFQNIVGVIVGFAVFVSPLDACPQITRVSSNMPRSFRSLISPAQG